MAKPILPSGKHHRAFKGQAYPNSYQAQYLLRCIGCSRYVYNALLHLMQYSYHWHQGNQEALLALKVRPDLQSLYWLMQLQTYKDEYATQPMTVGPNQSFLSYIVSCLKSHEDKAWLSEVPRSCLTYSVEALVKAFQSFYRLVKLKKHIGPNGLIGFPRYKSRHSKLAVRIQASDIRMCSYGSNAKHHEIRLPHCQGLFLPPGQIKIKGLRKLQGRLLSVAFTLTQAQDWSVSVLTETDLQVRPTGYGVIGIDLSAQRSEVGYCQDSSQAFSLSQIEQLPKSISVLESRIQHLQRLLARKTKGSYRWRTLKLRIAKAHRRLKAVYEGYYHRLTNWLIQTYDSIIIEDLDAKGMLSKSHSSLAKLVQDSRFSLFRSMLLYKLQQTEKGILGIADRYYPSSQICSSCGAKSSTKLPLHVRSWTCEVCQAQHHRDFNAAHNLYKLKQHLESTPPDTHLVLLEPYQV